MCLRNVWPVFGLLPWLSLAWLIFVPDHCMATKKIVKEDEWSLQLSKNRLGSPKLIYAKINRKWNTDACMVARSHTVEWHESRMESRHHARGISVLHEPSHQESIWNLVFKASPRRPGKPRPWASWPPCQSSSYPFFLLFLLFSLIFYWYGVTLPRLILD
jgi:hypothetical protein